MARVGQTVVSARNTSSWRIPRSAPRDLWLRQLLAIIVARIADDRVNMVGAALRGIFDHQSRPLDAVVDGAAVGGRAPPGEVGIGKLGLDLGHSGRGSLVGQEVNPGADQLEQQTALRIGE